MSNVSVFRGRLWGRSAAGGRRLRMEVLEQRLALAADFLVNSTADSDDGDLGNGITTLREAINAANALPGHDTIAFDLPAGATIRLTSSELWITDSLAIDGPGAELLAIDASSADGIRVFNVGSVVPLTMPGDFIVATSDNSPPNEGVANAIDDDAATKYVNFDPINAGFTVTPSIGPTVVRGVVLTSADDAPERDPAYYRLEGSNDGVNFEPVSEGTVPVFADRSSSNTIYFGLYNADPFSSYRLTFPEVVGPDGDSMQIAEVELLGSPASNDIDVAISGLTLTGGDSLGSGGAIYNAQNLTIIGCSIRGNREGTGVRGVGGGIYNAGTLTVVASTIDGNRAYGSFGYSAGGGIFNAGALTIVDSTISGNGAYFGGGVANQGSLTITGSTISGNGGRIAGITSSGILKNSSSTITGNGNGVNVSIGGDSAHAEIGGSIVAGSADDDLVVVGSGTFVSLGNNLFGRLEVPYHVSDLVGVDPLLGPLADNGGPTLTHALLPGSPAIDAIVDEAYGGVVLGDAPVAYYRFEETSGTTAANSGSLGQAGNGSFAGGVTLDAAGFSVDLGRAVSLDGTSGFVDTPITGTAATATITLEAWVRPSMAQADRTGIVGINDAVEFGFTDAATVQFWTPTTGALDVPYDSGANADEWVHLVAVGTGSEKRIYINGELAGTQAHAPLPPQGYGASTFPLRIGGGGFFDDPAVDGNFLRGDIDEVAVYDAALSADQVRRHYLAASHAAIPTTDQRGFPRPSGASYDIGAFEVQSPTCTGGDANGDSHVDRADVAILARNFGRSVAPCTNGDFDGNGVVALADIGLLQARLEPTNVSPSAAEAAAGSLVVEVRIGQRRAFKNPQDATIATRHETLAATSRPRHDRAGRISASVDAVYEMAANDTLSATRMRARRVRRVADRDANTDAV